MAELRGYKKITVADGVDGTVDLVAYVKEFSISGTETLTANWAITATGTPIEGMTCYFFYDAAVTLGGNTITILGQAIPDEFASKKYDILARYNGSTWKVKVFMDLGETSIIKNDHIIDATIANTKLASAPTGNIVGTSDTQDLTNKSLYDSSVSFVDEADNTKVLKFSLGGATTSKTTTITSTHTSDRVLTLPDVTDTLTGKTTTDTLTNKTLTSPVINTATITNGSISGATINVPTGDLSINSVAITSTSAELNYLDGSLPGTIVASKAVIADTNTNIGIAKISALHIGATGVETQMTSTAAELNYLDGSTPGTGVASKAIVLDVNKDVDLGTGDLLATQLTGTLQTASQTNITGVGTLTTGTWSADTIALTKGGTGAVTASAALDNLGAGSIGKAIFADTTASAVRTEITLGNVENTALSTWVGTTNITATGTITTGTWNASQLDGSYIADSAVKAVKLGSETSAGITTGVQAIQFVAASTLKGLLAGGTSNLFAVKAGDIILRILVNTEVASTTACNITLGLSNVADAEGDSDGILTTYAINGGASPRSVDSSSIDTGAKVARGVFTILGDGYITITSDANVSADATLIIGAQLFYIPV